MRGKSLCRKHNIHNRQQLCQVFPSMSLIKYTCTEMCESLPCFIPFMVFVKTDQRQIFVAHLSLQLENFVRFFLPLDSLNIHVQKCVSHCRVQYLSLYPKTFILLYQTFFIVIPQKIILLYPKNLFLYPHKLFWGYTGISLSGGRLVGRWAVGRSVCLQNLVRSTSPTVST